MQSNPYDETTKSQTSATCYRLCAISQQPASTDAISRKDKQGTNNLLGRPRLQVGRQQEQHLLLDRLHSPDKRNQDRSNQGTHRRQALLKLQGQRRQVPLLLLWQGWSWGRPVRKEVFS